MTKIHAWNLTRSGGERFAIHSPCERFFLHAVMKFLIERGQYLLRGRRFGGNRSRARKWYQGIRTWRWRLSLKIQSSRGGRGSACRTVRSIKTSASLGASIIYAGLEYTIFVNQDRIVTDALPVEIQLQNPLINPLTQWVSRSHDKDWLVTHVLPIGRHSNPAPVVICVLHG